MPSAFRGNKSLDYYFSYHDPSQAAFTPAKRRYSVWGPIVATSAGRAMSKFWKEVLDEEGWGKDDIVLLGVMPSPSDVTKLDDEIEDEEDD